MAVVEETPRKPGWAETHLNWTVVLAEIAVNIVLGIIFTIIFLLAFSVEYMSSGDVGQSLFWVMTLVNTFIHLAIILPVAGWALRKKGRRLWWLLILFVPVAGWVVYLCLNNRRTERTPQSSSDRYRYFAYGSNMDTCEVKSWCRRKGTDATEYNPAIIGPAVLEGYRLDFNYYSKGGWGAGAANIMAAPGERVHGLLMVINETELGIIRAKEGVRGGAYEEIRVTVTKTYDDSNASDVITYKVAADKEESRFQPPTAEYMSILTEAAEKYEFPEDYREMLRNIETK